MNVELIVQDSKKGTIYDLSEVVKEITWETELAEQPGKCSFTYLDSEDVLISNGSIVSFKMNGKGIFYGYVFKKGLKKDGKVPVTAYDQLRYLKNKDIDIFKNMTASEIFTNVCKKAGLKSRVVNASTYKIITRLHDNKTRFEMIQFGLDQTLGNTGQWFIIRDNFGTIDFVNLNTLKTTLVIGDESLLIDYDFEKSIDEDTFNQIKLLQEITPKKDDKTAAANSPQQEKIRDIYVVKDSKSIAEWGQLQYFEKVDEKYNKAQIQTRAEQLLKIKNRETKTLSLSALGHESVFAGTGIVLAISDLVKEGIPINKYFLVMKAEHSYKNDIHTMKLDLQVI